MVDAYTLIHISFYLVFPPLPYLSLSLIRLLEISRGIRSFFFSFVLYLLSHFISLPFVIYNFSLYSLFLNANCLFELTFLNI